MPPILEEPTKVKIKMGKFRHTRHFHPDTDLASRSSSAVTPWPWTLLRSVKRTCSYAPVQTRDNARDLALVPHCTSCHVQQSTDQRLRVLSQHSNLALFCSRNQPQRTGNNLVVVIVFSVPIFPQVVSLVKCNYDITHRTPIHTNACCTILDVQGLGPHHAPASVAIEPKTETEQHPSRDLKL